MEPLLGEMPLVGALSLFFLKKPVSPDSDDVALVFNSIKPVWQSSGGSYNDATV